MAKAPDPIQLSKWATEFFGMLHEGSTETILTYWQEHFWVWEDGVYVPVPPEVMQDKILIWLTSKGYTSVPDHAHGVMINLRAMVRAPMSTEINTWLKPLEDTNELDVESEQRSTGRDEPNTNPTDPEVV